MSNYPDNWHALTRTCWRCGARYHASEWCDCGDLADEQLEAAQAAADEARIEAAERAEQERRDERWEAA